MSKKSIIWLIIIIIIAGVLVWYRVSRKPAEEVIKIGAILPLTGGASIQGLQIKNGIELATEAISNLTLLYEDSKCNPSQGISAYNKLINIDKVKIIIGDFCSSVVLGIAPLAENDHVLLITPGAAARKISEAGDYILETT